MDLNGRPIPDATIEAPDNMSIVAYNFDIVNGAPSQWVGAVSNGSNSTESETTGRDTSVEEIIKYADDDIKEKQNQKLESGTKEERSVGNISVIDDWGDWNHQFDTTSLYESDNGNRNAYTVEWKSDPDDYSNHGVNLETRIYPNRDPSWLKYRIMNNTMEFDYNGSVISRVEDYGPGNTVGSTATSIDLALSSGRQVSVGLSRTMTESDLTINNYSQTDWDDLVEHEFDIGGSINKNTVRLNQTALTEGTDPQSGSDYVEFQTETVFDNHINKNTIWQPNTLLWS